MYIVQRKIFDPFEEWHDETFALDTLEEARIHVETDKTVHNADMRIIKVIEEFIND